MQAGSREQAGQAVREREAAWQWPWAHNMSTVSSSSSSSYYPCSCSVPLSSAQMTNQPNNISTSSSQGLNTLVILVSWCCSCSDNSSSCCAQFGYVFDLRRFFIAWPVYFFEGGDISKICIANVTKGLRIAELRCGAVRNPCHKYNHMCLLPQSRTACAPIWVRNAA